MVEMPFNNEKYIYHFTKSETALLYILPNMRLKLSSYLESNDPKENKTFGYWSIFENFDSFTQVIVQEYFESLLREICKHLCFSTDYSVNDLPKAGFYHPTMWAHYADNSKGVCLAIDKELFLKENPNLHNDIISYESVLKFPRLEVERWQNDKENYIKSFLIENIKDMFFKKHVDWSVENEFKIIDLGENKNEYCSIEKSFKEIYLGVDFDDRKLPVLKKLISEDKIYRLTIQEGNYYSFPNYK